VAFGGYDNISGWELSKNEEMKVGGLTRKREGRKGLLVGKEKIHSPYLQI